MKTKSRIFLVGMMGAGKTTVGRQLAKRLGKTFRDADREIEERTGVSVAVIFEIEGEAGFRKREAEAIEHLTTLDDIVLATGGGAVLDPRNRENLRSRGCVIYLHALPPVLWQRTRTDKSRPLLQGGDPRERLETLYGVRDPLYREVADVVIDTGRQGTARRSRALARFDEACRLQRSSGERSPIHVGTGLLARPDLIVPFLQRKNVAVVTNATVAPLFLEKLAGGLSREGVEVVRIVLPDGEEHKDWKTLGAVFDVLLEKRCGRDTTLVALGGGVIGDLAGFAAATYQRGVQYIQVPTTLLAQVDSSVGGKTAINHPLGKNMIGAFHQPRLVLADMDTLRTLPERELRSGLAEVIKHGLVRDAAFFAWLEANIERLLARDPDALERAVLRSVAIKAEIVASDERESGLRRVLNFGHTFGHAIERGLGARLHGVAVAAGMQATDLFRQWVISRTATRSESAPAGACRASGRRPGIAPERIHS